MGANLYYCSTAQELFGYCGRLFVEIGYASTSSTSSSTSSLPLSPHSALGLLVGTCAAFFVIIIDLAPVLVVHLIGTNLALEQLRLLVPVALAVCVVLPLCLLRSLESLSAISILSIMFYISLVAQLAVMAVRVVLKGEAGRVEIWHMEGAFTSLPIFSLAFSCHL